MSGKSTYHLISISINVILCLIIFASLLIVGFGEGGTEGRREIKLTCGQEFTVAPGVWHEFRAYEDSEMIEEMFVDYNEDDIERAKLGGSFGVPEEEDLP